MQIRIENLLIAICILIFTVIYVEVKLIDGQQHLKLIQELNEKNTFLQQRIIDTEAKLSRVDRQKRHVQQLVGDLQRWKKDIEYKFLEIYSSNLQINYTLLNQTLKEERERIPVYRLAIGILSRHESRDNRDVIRDTWLTFLDGTPKKNFTYRFLLGNIEDKDLYEKSQLENEEYGDIIFVDQMDTYKNLSYKTMEFFRWASENIQIDYAFKTDDDTFLRLDKLMDLLDHVPATKYWGGRVLGNYVPQRDVKNQFYIPFEEYPSNKGPPLVSGAGYLLSRDCVAFLGEKTHQKDFKYIRYEDVNTMVILEEIGVRGQMIERSMMNGGGCEDDMLYSHYCSVSQLRYYFHNVKNSGRPCDKKATKEEQF